MANCRRIGAQRSASTGAIGHGHARGFRGAVERALVHSRRNSTPTGRAIVRRDLPDGDVRNTGPRRTRPPHDRCTPTGERSVSCAELAALDARFRAPSPAGSAAQLLGEAKIQSSSLSRHSLPVMLAHGRPPTPPVENMGRARKSLPAPLAIPLSRDSSGCSTPGCAARLGVAGSGVIAPRSASAGRAVQFAATRDNSFYNITPYSNVYGQHPSFFNFNRKGEMQLTDDGIAEEMRQDELQLQDLLENALGNVSVRASPVGCSKAADVLAASLAAE